MGTDSKLLRCVTRVAVLTNPAGVDLVEEGEIDSVGKGYIGADSEESG